MAIDLATLAQDVKDIAARLDLALQSAATQPTTPAIALQADAPPTQTPTETGPPLEATTAPTVLSVPADTAATLTVAPADTVQQVVQDTANLAASLVAPALGGTTAVSALEKSVIGDVATGDTAGAVATLATTAKTLEAKAGVLETTAQAHTDQIAALEQKVLQLAGVKPSTLRFINIGLLIGAAIFFVAMQVAAASGNVWASHNVALAGVVLAIAAALNANLNVA